MSTAVATVAALNLKLDYNQAYPEDFNKSGRVSKKHKCPICDGDSGCWLDSNGYFIICMRRSTDTGAWVFEREVNTSPTGYKFRNRSVPSWKEYNSFSNETPEERKERLTRWIADKKAKELAAIEQAEAEKAYKLSDTLIDKINRSIFDKLALTQKHKEYLVGEGLPAKDVQACRSIDYSQCFNVARAIVEEFGASVALRHPAIQLVKPTDGKNPYWKLSAIPRGCSGIIYPAINERGLLLGLSIRFDDVILAGKKYTWLSRDGLNGTPLCYFQAAPAAASNPDMLVITEGYKKGAVASARWGCSALAIVGVTAYDLNDLLAAIKQANPKTIAIAFDADKTTKKEVARAEQVLINALSVALPNINLQIINWQLSKGKGLDDAWKTPGVTAKDFVFSHAAPHSYYTFEGETFKIGNQFQNNLPLAAHAAAFPQDSGLRVVETLQTARNNALTIVKELVLTPKGTPLAFANTNPTGTGKSTTTDNALLNYTLDGTLDLNDKRAIILVPDKNNLNERTDPATTDLGKRLAMQDGRFAIQRGRNPVNVDVSDPASLAQARANSTPFDCYNPDAKEAGNQRQITAKVVCSKCPFGSPENWQKAGGVGDMPFNCQEEGYLASRKRSDAATLVIATSEAYLNDSDLLDKFDIVVKDEAIEKYLIEDDIAISSDTLADWSASLDLQYQNGKMDKSTVDFWQGLFKILNLALDDMPALFASQAKFESSLFPAMPTIINAAKALKAARLKIQLATLSDDAESETYSFELPYRDNNDRGKLKIPYRAIGALVEALNDGDRLLRAARQGSIYYFQIRRPRRHLIEMLNSKQFLLLDATLNPTVKKLMPHIQEKRTNVAQPLIMTQITNALLTARDLENDKTRANIEKSIAAYLETIGAKKAVVVLPKRYSPNNEKSDKPLQLPDGVDVLTWGLHRATNQYSGYDAVVMLGHFVEPLDIIQATLDATRSYTGDRPICQTQTEGQGQGQKLKVYNYTDGGKAYGHWRRVSDDPDLQEAIEHSHTANIVQAFGRGRAVLRDLDKPLHVLLLSSEPTPLKIDKLCTTSDLIAGLVDYEKIGYQEASAAPLSDTLPLDGTLEMRQPPILEPFHIYISENDIKTYPASFRTPLVETTNTSATPQNAPAADLVPAYTETDPPKFQYWRDRLTACEARTQVEKLLNEAMPFLVEVQQSNFKVEAHYYANRLNC